MKDKSSQITQLQYANAIFIERNTNLEKELVNAVNVAKEWQKEYTHIYDQILYIFGDKYGHYFMKRGGIFPKKFLDGVRKLIKECEDELYSN